MRVRPLFLHLALLGMVLPGVAVLGAGTAQADEPPVVGRSGTLTQRPTGQPTSSTPARQLSSAKLTTSVREDRARATVVLRAVPTSAQNARLRLTLGEWTGGTCDGQIEYATPTTGTPAAGWSRSGAAYTLNSTAHSVYSSYDCAFAALTEPGGTTTTYDLLGGSLAPVHAKADLLIKSAKLLGSKKLKLVKGVWTPIVVDVHNVGEFQAGRITVTGKGKGLKVKKATTSYDLYDDSSASITVKVKLTKKRATKLKLTARGTSAAKTSKSFTVKPTSAPPRIKDGKYRSKDKRITFQVKRGKLTGFRVYAMTTCGGYPDFPTHTWNYYSIKSSKIPKSGIIDIVEKGKLYTASLVGLAKGKKVTKARFTYSGPNRCWAAVNFTAKRIG